MLSDEDLMIKVQQGNLEAYNLLYSRHVKSLYKFIYLNIRQKQTAEDVLQESFIRVYTKKHQFKSEKALFRTWLYRIAYRVCIDYHRKQTKYSYIDIEKTEHLLPTKNTVENEIIDTIFIESFLNDLPHEDRAVLLLTYYQGLTGHEISQILKIPEGTIKSRRHHIIKKLSKRFSGRVGNINESATK